MNSLSTAFLAWAYGAAALAIPLPGHDDYVAAYRAAREHGRMLLVLFGEPNATPAAQTALASLKSDSVRTRVQELYELVYLPLDATAIHNGGEPAKLLDQEGFSELHHQSGFAIVDLTCADSPYFGKVVFIHPFSDQFPLTSSSWRVILNLPPGSLTQRMLTYAVRTHPEHPASASSRPLGLLMRAAERHANRQAELQLQGHHRWDERFQKLLKKLPGDTVPFEVCAESWPGETLIEACHECVHSWRQSDGHWRLVSQSNRFFGYDMSRGENGVWYATGVFAIPRNMESKE